MLKLRRGKEHTPRQSIVQPVREKTLEERLDQFSRGLPTEVKINRFKKDTIQRLSNGHVRLTVPLMNPEMDIDPDGELPIFLQVARELRTK